MSTTRHGLHRKTIFLVDDHPVLRRGLKLVFDEESDLEVCGEAAGAVEALAALRAGPPDIALIDLSLQEGNGLDLVRQVREALPRLPVLVLSAQPESRFAEPCLRAGAQGYIEKTEDASQVVVAIREVLSGRIYLSDAMKERIMWAWPGGPRGPAAPNECLSERELVIFELIGQGKKTRDIADQLCVSRKTVQAFRDKIRAKLALANGTELQHAAFLWVNERNAPSL